MSCVPSGVQLQILGNPVSDRLGICRAWRWIIAAAVTVPLVAAPPAATAQQAAKVWRIGTLHSSPSSDEADRVAALQRGLAELGYVGGRNVLFVNRNAGTQMSRLPDLATELVH